MIHYTLLPENEIRRLRREYRFRIIIFFFFFTSCAVLVGIISLAPAYIYSYSEEKTILDKIGILQKNREAEGKEAIIDELKRDNVTIKKIQSYNNSVLFSQIINQILIHKTSGVTVSFFDLSLDQTATSSVVKVFIQGKALNRESLIGFKEALGQDPSITKFELPVSDLAKSRDISYSIRLSIIPTL